MNPDQNPSPWGFPGGPLVRTQHLPKKKKKKRMKEKHIHTHNSVTLPYHSGYSTQKHKFLPYPPIFFLKEITIISLGLF